MLAKDQLRSINERPTYQDQLQLAMPIHQSNQLTSLSVDIPLTSMAKTTTILEPTDSSLPPSKPKDTTKKLSWLTSFLIHQKIAQSKKTHELKSSNSNCQSRIAWLQAQKACHKNEYIKHMHPTTKPNSPLLPTTQVNELSKKKPSTHSQFSQRYDLRVCLEGMQGQVLSEWEAIYTLLLQVHTINKKFNYVPGGVRIIPTIHQLTLTTLIPHSLTYRFMFHSWQVSRKVGDQVLHPAECNTLTFFWSP